jgi:uncharacterized protein (DUF433 family)
MEFGLITIDPAKMRGVPCIRGMRIPVGTVLAQLSAGRTESEILADFPDLEDIRQPWRTPPLPYSSANCPSP